MGFIRLLFLFLCVCFVSACSFAPSYQVIIPASYQYEWVVEAPGVSRSSLLFRANNWVDSVYKPNTKDVTDSDIGMTGFFGDDVVAIRHYSYSDHVVLEYQYSFSIDVRDNKSRLRFFDFRGVVTPSSVDYVYSDSQLREVVDLLAASFAGYMRNKDGIAESDF